MENYEVEPVFAGGQNRTGKRERRVTNNTRFVFENWKSLEKKGVKEGNVIMFFRYQTGIK